MALIRAALIVLAAASAIAGSVPAYAHHPTGGGQAPLRATGSVTTEHATWLQASSSAMGLDVDGMPALAWTLALAAQLRVTDALAVRARLPFHMLTVDGDASAESLHGLGDASVGIAWRAAWGGGIAVMAGLDVFAPLGDDDLGLGGGAVAVEPFARVEFAVRPGWRLGADASLYTNLTNRDAAFTSFDRFAVTELGVGAEAARATSRLQLGLGVRALTALAPSSERGALFATVEPTAHVHVGDGVWLGARAAVPVMGEGKYGWQVGASVLYAVPAPASHHTIQPAIDPD